MVFNATFNNISVISWWSVLLVDKTEYPEKTNDPSQVTDKLHIMLYPVTSPWMGFDCTLHTDCTNNCKSNYHTITTVPLLLYKNCVVHNRNLNFIILQVHVGMNLKSKSVRSMVYIFSLIFSWPNVYFLLCLNIYHLWKWVNLNNLLNLL